MLEVLLRLKRCCSNGALSRYYKGRLRADIIYKPAAPAPITATDLILKFGDFILLTASGFVKQVRDVCFNVALPLASVSECTDHTY